MNHQRIQVWERKLLDLTLSNALINTKFGTNCLRTIDSANREFVEYLVGKDFIPIHPNDGSANGIHFDLNRNELSRWANILLTKAYDNLDETGSEQLFLSFGILQWVENPDPLHPNKPCGIHEAPIALFPVGIQRNKVNGDYYLLSRAEEVMPNITLIELLKQDHERDLSALISSDGSAVSFDTIYSTFKKCAESKADKGWNLSNDICIGLFAFAKFVMWNDLHTNSETMRKAPIVESLIQKRILDGKTIPPCDARILDKTIQPNEHIFPLDADSSQVEAIVDAEYGKSFLLYGPPGTGKSQTITNMIANSIYHGQTVLFVAQKRAALEVVQERLTAIGLTPYFIELHSNKATKTHLINQLSEALAQADTQLKNISFPDELLSERKQCLLNYTEAVHTKNEIANEKISLADCIDTCLRENAPYPKLLPRKVLLGLTQARLQEVEKLLREMIQIEPDRAREQGELAIWVIEVKNFLHFRIGISTVTAYHFHRQWKKRKQQLTEWKLLSLLPILKQIGIERLMQHLRYEVAQTKAMFLIENNETLLLFRGKAFDEVVADYRQKMTIYKEDCQQQLLLQQRQVIRDTLLSPNPKVQASLVEIRRWIKNRGRNVSIRSLMEAHGDVVRRLCPCILMSPMSVSQYLPITNKPFDLVLFDEASQIPTAEAIGAIARSTTTVIVGDPKQMPPTTFFQRNICTDDDVEHNDMESILDDCITLGMPEHYLNYHYRSHHESLIAFSNHYYYDDKLITFPSVDDRESHIHYRKIQGVYDYSKTRTNRIEAEAIVNEVIRRLKDSELRKSSMGVIAFSTIQQNLIYELLQERIGHDKTLLETAYGEDVAEPLFVKNLENVQGDERDVILFSVCYGPAEDGNVSMNFGPLNNAGGERRLNVAVTRARQEMVVFSSMTSSDIDLEKSQALGVIGLKNFLYYAEQGKLPEDTNPTHSIDTSPLAEHLAADLNKAGYQVDKMVGKSDFRVDLAVLDPKQPNTYQLGILFDGDGYYRTPMVRDREYIQPRVLEHLGWRIIRVWQEDYFRHPQEVTNRIIELLKNTTNKSMYNYKTTQYE